MMEENNFKPGSTYARVIRGDTTTLDQVIPSAPKK